MIAEPVCAGLQRDNKERGALSAEGSVCADYVNERQAEDIKVKRKERKKPLSYTDYFFFNSVHNDTTKPQCDS